MSRKDYSRNESGLKNKVQIRLDGETLDREFRNKGEAIQYLQKREGLRKDEISRRVKFICS